MSRSRGRSVTLQLSRRVDLLKVIARTILPSWVLRGTLYSFPVVFVTRQLSDAHAHAIAACLLTFAVAGIAFFSSELRKLFLLYWTVERLRIDSNGVTHRIGRLKKRVPWEKALAVLSDGKGSKFLVTQSGVFPLGSSENAVLLIRSITWKKGISLASEMNPEVEAAIVQSWDKACFDAAWVASRMKG